jgi:hypothetical protein
VEYFGEHPTAYIDFALPISRPMRENLGELLSEIYRQLFDVTLSVGLTDDELVTSLARSICKSSKFPIVSLDNIDLMLSRVRRQFREKALPQLQEGVNNPQQYMRVITIAQYQLADLNGVQRIHFYPKPIEVFSGVLHDELTYKRLLTQAVERYDRTNVDPTDAGLDKRLRNWAHKLYELSGGHPYAIERTLNYIGRSYGFRDPEVFDVARKGVCTEVLQAIVYQQVERELGTDNEERIEAFNQLWLFRYLSPGIFSRFLSYIKNKKAWKPLNKVVQTDDLNNIGKSPLWLSFEQTRLLQENKRRTRFFTHILAPVWRKMGNIILEVTDTNRGTTMHRDIYDFFRKIALDIEDDNYDINSRIPCFREGLYHLSLTKSSPQKWFSEALNYQSGFLTSLRDKPFLTESLSELYNGIYEDDELIINMDRRMGRDNTVQLLERIRTV